MYNRRTKDSTASFQIRTLPYTRGGPDAGLAVPYFISGGSEVMGVGSGGRGVDKTVLIKSLSPASDAL